MGDDFDLFPKRENLDPFSFGRKEKGAADEKEEAPTEDIFGGASPTPGAPLPDFGQGQPPVQRQAAPSGKGRPVPTPPDLGPAGPSLPTADELDRPAPHAAPRAARGKTTSRKEAQGRKPSPFVLIGGSMLIVLLVLYGVMTYLKRSRPPAPAPQASVAVPVPVAAVEPKPPAAEPAPPAAGQVPPAPDAVKKAPASPAAPTPSATAPTGPAPVNAAMPAKPVQSPPPAPTRAAAAPAAVKPAAGDGYTVQVGSLILKASIRELESKLKGLGYQPFEKEGTTTALMNHLTVGPFGSAAAASQAADRLKASGVEAEPRKRPGGQAVVFAGSYLLRENADDVMKKVRALGYAVERTEREAQLPMTSVRVGRHATIEEANAARDKLKGQGFEPVVVRLP